MNDVNVTVVSIFSSKGQKSILPDVTNLTKNEAYLA